MDKLHSLLLYVSAHWETIIAILTAAISVLGTLRAVVERWKGHTATEADHWIGYLMDVLAFVARNGQRGLFGAINLPLWPSMPAKPAAPPTQPARGFVRGDLMLALACTGLLVLAIMAGGCATPGGQALGKCELGALPTTVEAVISDVAAILANTGNLDWQHDLVTLGEQVGPSQVNCVVQAVTAAASAKMPTHGQPSPSLLTTIQRGQIWAASHKRAACK